jgi:hypothetical protein
MAEIEIGPLTQRLSDEEIAELAGSLETAGAPRLPRAEDDSPVTLGDTIDEEVMVEFLDRLESHDIACEIYLPVEFDARLEVADLRVGSAVLLLEALEELKDELAIEEDDEDEEDEVDEDDDDAILASKLRDVWRALWEGAQASIERGLPLHIQS